MAWTIPKEDTRYKALTDYWGASNWRVKPETIKSDYDLNYYHRDMVRRKELVAGGHITPNQANKVGEEMGLKAIERLYGQLIKGKTYGKATTSAPTPKARPVRPPKRTKKKFSLENIVIIEDTGADYKGHAGRIVNIDDTPLPATYSVAIDGDLKKTFLYREDSLRMVTFNKGDRVKIIASEDMGVINEEIPAFIEDKRRYGILFDDGSIRGVNEDELELCKGEKCVPPPPASATSLSAEEEKTPRSVSKDSKKDRRRTYRTGKKTRH